MSIEPLQEQWLATIAEWHQQEWSHLNPGETLVGRVERMRDYMSPSALPSMWVKVIDGAPVATAALVVNDLPQATERTPWLASVYTLPQWRGRGIASEMVRHVMAQAKHLGFANLWLYTPDAEAFYQQLGWQLVEPAHVHGEPVTIMCTKPAAF